jgi:hypothetical protein
MKLATAPKTKAGAIDCEITCESCDGGGVSSIRFPHVASACTVRAIQRIRIAHNEDRISDRSGGRSPRSGSQAGRRSARAARTRSPAEDEWIHLKSMITPSAPSASCSPRRCVLKTMETPLSFFSHSVPAP